MNDTMERAIATIELISVARGILAADAMLKAADVRLYEAHPICPGKYLVVVGGQVGAVEESLRAGVRIGREAVSDHMILPNVHPDVFRALAMATEPGSARAIGIVETMAAPCAIEGADAAAKAAKQRSGSGVTTATKLNVSKKLSIFACGSVVPASSGISW